MLPSHNITSAVALRSYRTTKVQQAYRPCLTARKQSGKIAYRSSIQATSCCPPAMPLQQLFRVLNFRLDSGHFDQWGWGGRGCSPHNPQISQYYTETLSHLEEFPHLSLNYPNKNTIFITHFQSTSFQTQFFKLKTYFVLYSVQVNITIYNSQIYTV